MFVHTQNILNYISMGGAVTGICGIKKITLFKSDVIALSKMIEHDPERAFVYLGNLILKMDKMDEISGAKADTIIIDDVEG